MPTYPNPLLDATAIDEEVDPGLLRRLGNVGISGVSAAGNILDLPGSTVRDALALKNPFDQWLPWNWASSENRTSGRDLLRQYGLAGKEDTYGNWWGGFAGEIALDPLTYIGAGALLKGAQAGTAGTKGLLRASLPFSKAGVELGTGARAEAVAKGLGGLGDYLTKPSVLGPALESGAEYLTGKLPADEGIEFTRTYKPPKKTARSDFLNTLGTDTIQKQRDELQQRIAQTVQPANPLLKAVNPANWQKNWTELAEESDSLYKVADDQYDKLVAGGMSPDDALNHPSVRTIDDKRIAMEQQLAGMYDAAVVNAISKAVLPGRMTNSGGEVVTSAAKSARHIAESVYSSHPVNPHFMFEYGRKALEDRAGSIDKLSKEFMDVWLRENNFDEGIFGPISGMSKESQDELMAGFIEAATKTHDQIATDMLGHGRSVARPAVQGQIPVSSDVRDLTELARLDKELAARAAGSQPIDLAELAKSGEMGRVDIAPTNINEIDSVVPKTAPEVAPWALKGAELLTAPARAAQMLFHAPVMGKFGEEPQSLARKQWEKIGKAHQESLEEATKFVDDYHEIEKGFSESFGTELGRSLPEALAKSPANVAKTVRDTMERVFGMAAETDDAAESLKFFKLDPSKAPELTGKIGALGRRMKEVNSTIYKSYLEMGGKGDILPKIDAEAIPELAEVSSLPGFAHFPRFGAEHPDNVLKALKGGSTRAAGSMARHEALRAVPREVIERIGKLGQEIQSQGMGEREFAESIADKFGKWLNRETVDAVDEAGDAIKVAKWGTPEAHAEALAKWGTNADNYATYLNDNLKAESRYLRGLFTAKANMAAIYDTLKQTIGRRPLEAALPDEALPKGTKQLRGLLDATKQFGDQPLVNVADVFQRANMDVDKSLAWLARQLGDTSEEAIAQLRDHGAIPAAVAQAIEGSRKVTQVPEWAQTVAGIVDIPTRWFKENVTLPFLSFATRNLASGQYLVAATGVLENLDDLKNYGQQLAKAFDDFRHGQIGSEQQREWFVNGVLHEDMLFEGVETRMGQFGHVAPDRIDVRDAFTEAAQQIEPSMLDRVPGLRTARQIHGTVLNTGAKINRFVEYLNRVPLYETLKAKGWSPEAAARKVAELQVDYSKHNFSPFENEVMRRLVPFYSWQRRIGPVILGSLARSPAGPMGLTVRGSRLASSDDPRVPEWLSGSLAIENPLGSSEEGGRSYFTGFGLPYEPVLGFFGGGVRGAGREVLSQLNPLIKAPLEWSTGQSFFQTGPSGTGRPLDELNPPVGQTLANVARFAGRDPSTPVPTPAGLEFALSNSPLSRYVTTARQVTDPRKHPLSLGMNLLTGVRVSDISPSSQDAVLRERANALLRAAGGRTFTQTYVPRDADPADRELVEQLKELQTLIAKRQRARRK